MLPTSKLRDFRPVIMTPTHNHSVFVNYFIGMFDLMHAAGAHGMQVDVHIISGESLITRARNNAVAHFLRNENWTHLLWIDADIGFQPQAVFRLLLSDYDVCAGVYPIKIEIWPEGGPPAGLNREDFINRYARYPVNTDAIGSQDIFVEILEDGFIKLREAPTGLMCVKRSVFEKMCVAYPELKMVNDMIGVPHQGFQYNFFDTSIDPETRRYLSEDYHFCRLWERIGGAVYVDATSNLTHQGYKTYQGDFSATVSLNPGQAIGATVGKVLHVNGLDKLERNRAQPLPSADES